MAAFFSLAAVGSMAALSAPQGTTRMESKPMATSTMAAPTNPIVSSVPSVDHSSANKVQFRTTVQRRGSSIQKRLLAQTNQLPFQFRFYSDATACEEAGIEEVPTNDILSGSKPYEVSVEAFQGRRETMEDEVVVHGGGRFAGVFDGHGGGEVSSYLKRNLYHLFLLHLEQKHWEESDSDVEDIRQETPSISAYMAAIRQALRSVETEVIQHRDLTFVGSTAVAVILHENPGGYRTIISANVGDSRAILCRNGKAVDLTKDHKPTAEGERKRILKAGGMIFLDDTGVHRVMNLSLSRAIGDGFSKPIVSPEPDIRRFRVEEDGDDFCLLACDGLWDVMSSQDAVNFVNARLAESPPDKLAETRQKMAEEIVQEAMRLGSADNTSVVMVWLKNP